MSEDSYVLKRDYNASTRLTAGHFICKQTLGYLLHPSIPVPLNARIADVATGNGIWLLDLATTLPKSRTLEGFDISLDQVPAKNPLSTSNLRFHTWDILRDPPAEFVEAFDIVHVRLITVVVRDNDPTLAINGLRKMLKPGGHLQWEEVDNVGCNVISPPGDDAPALKKVLAQISGASKNEWKRHAIYFLNKEGFCNTQEYYMKYDSMLGKYYSDWNLSTWAELASREPDDPKQAEILRQDAMEEVRRGAFPDTPIYVWLAQKPLH